MSVRGSNAAPRSLRAGLADLLLQPLAEIAHALVLVWIGRTQATHFGGNLTDLLPVDAGEGQTRLLRVYRYSDSVRQRVLNWVRKPEAEHDHVLALQFGAVPNAYNFQFTRPALGDAFNGVVDQRARQAMHGRMIVILAIGDKVAVLLDELNALREPGFQRALGALHLHDIVRDRDLHALRDRDRL